MKQKGFTLIELLVVIAIIGLLSSVVLASLATAREKSRDARRVSDIRQIAQALELYFDDNEAYPTCSTAFLDNQSNCLTTALVGGGYLPSMPNDPQYGNDGSAQWGYDYEYFGGGKVYNLRAALETAGISRTGNYPNGTTCQDGSFPVCSWYRGCVYEGYGPSCALTFQLGQNYN